ncbi:MAG: TatD family hydrolase [Proteobacteria bacterium]|nr:TatD family hydrolase [Pseudomonadota bacterium]
MIDIGINLAHDSYDADRAAVIERARLAGVKQMLVTGSSHASTLRAIELTQDYPNVLFATAGVHPHHATELTAQNMPALEQAARQPTVVAVGECGLDYFRDYSPRDAQRHAFSLQLELAARLGKPVFLHQREAHEDFVAILREHRGSLVGGVAHCFTGDRQQLEQYLGLGLAIGITGWICDERRGHHLKELVPHIPSDGLMIETDGPYLLPRDLRPAPRSRRNESCYLPHIAAAVADARRQSIDELTATSTAAAQRMFGLLLG